VGELGQEEGVEVRRFELALLVEEVEEELLPTFNILATCQLSSKLLFFSIVPLGFHC